MVPVCPPFYWRPISALLWRWDQVATGSGAQVGILSVWGFPLTGIGLWSITRDGMHLAFGLRVCILRDRVTREILSDGPEVRRGSSSPYLGDSRPAGRDDPWGNGPSGDGGGL